MMSNASVHKVYPVFERLLAEYRPLMTFSLLDLHFLKPNSRFSALVPLIISGEDKSFLG
jgi:hypothetical protein